MLDYYVSYREIRQIFRSVAKVMAISMLEESRTSRSEKVVYPELVRLPLKLYLYVPP